MAVVDQNDWYSKLELPMSADFVAAEDVLEVALLYGGIFIVYPELGPNSLSPLGPDSDGKHPPQIHAPDNTAIGVAQCLEQQWLMKIPGIASKYNSATGDSESNTVELLLVTLAGRQRIADIGDHARMMEHAESMSTDFVKNAPTQFRLQVGMGFVRVADARPPWNHYDFPARELGIALAFALHTNQITISNDILCVRSGSSGQHPSEASDTVAGNANAIEEEKGFFVKIFNRNNKQNTLVKKLTKSLRLNGLTKLPENASHDELIEHSINEVKNLGDKCKLAVEIIATHDALKASSITAEETKRLAIGTFIMAFLTFLMILQNGGCVYLRAEHWASLSADPKLQELEARSKQITESEANLSKRQNSLTQQEASLAELLRVTHLREAEVEKRERQLQQLHIVPGTSGHVSKTGNP
jgi:hypothetical protein